MHDDDLLFLHVFFMVEKEVFSSFCIVYYIALVVNRIPLCKMSGWLSYSMQSRSGLYICIICWLSCFPIPVLSSPTSAAVPCILSLSLCSQTMLVTAQLRSFQDTLAFFFEIFVQIPCYSTFCSPVYLLPYPALI